jgi:hypothetical protein
MRSSYSWETSKSTAPWDEVIKPFDHEESLFQRHGHCRSLVVGPVNLVKLFFGPSVPSREGIQLPSSADQCADGSRDFPSDRRALDRHGNFARGEEGYDRGGLSKKKSSGSNNVAFNVKIGLSGERDDVGWRVTVLVAFYMVVGQGDTKKSDGVQDLELDVNVRPKKVTGEGLKGASSMFQPGN